ASVPAQSAAHHRSRGQRAAAGQRQHVRRLGSATGFLRICAQRSPGLRRQLRVRRVLLSGLPVSLGGSAALAAVGGGISRFLGTGEGVCELEWGDAGGRLAGGRWADSAPPVVVGGDGEAQWL